MKNYIVYLPHPQTRLISQRFKCWAFDPVSFQAIDLKAANIEASSMFLKRKNNWFEKLKQPDAAKTFRATKEEIENLLKTFPTSFSLWEESVVPFL